MQTKIIKPNTNNLQLCASKLASGSLVAFPTETVYGLGANALLEDSVKKIFDAKGRPSDNPLIVHLFDKESIKDYAEVSDKAILLIDAFMPGPITILLKKKAVIPNVVTAGRDTVGIRIPANDVAREFLRYCNVPVCAPSANTSSRPSPTKAAHVYDDLYGKIEYILDGGTCDIGIESTIIDISTDCPMLLRKGQIALSDIERVLNERVLVCDTSSEALCPGLKYKHYSPKANVIIVSNGENQAQRIKELYQNQNSLGYKATILCYNENQDKYDGCDITALLDTNEYAKRFYSLLRDADKMGMDFIICEAPVLSDIGKALYNRMFKAAGGNVI